MAGPLRADVRKLGEALKGAGIDTRFWSSYGTVGVVGDDGVFDPTSSKAIHIAPDGVWVDVLLQPLQIPVTCRIQLGVGGVAHILAPVRPGSEVLVHLPDGNLMNAPVVAAILNNQGQKIPVGADGKPIFRNDRLFIQCGDDQPVEVHAKKIQFGSQEANENFVLGQKYKTEITKIANALVADVRGSPVGPIAPSPGLIQACNMFIAQLDSQLSTFIFGQFQPPTSGT